MSNPQSASTALPPSYSSLGNQNRIPSAGEIERIVTAWDVTVPQNFDTLGHTPNLVFTLLPTYLQGSMSRLEHSVKKFRQHARQPVWRASLVIRARNIPKLMSEGFHWAEREYHYRARDWMRLEEHTGALKRENHRVYTFAKHDAADRKVVVWYGHLHVYSNDAPTLTNFDISWITLDTITKTQAVNWQGKSVYLYDKNKSKRCHNTIFGQMPLTGFWPRPNSADEKPSAAQEKGLEKEHSTGSKETWRTKLSKILMPNKHGLKNRAQPSHTLPPTISK